MTYILACCGRKSAGKSTSASFLLERQYELFGESATPHVRAYGFADPLKELCIDLLGLSREQCYGTEEQKNTKTAVTWGMFPDQSMRLALKNGRDQAMTAREVLQCVGSDIFRRMSPDCWVRAVLRKVDRDAPTLAVIADCRFANEVQGVQRAGGRAVLLSRSPYQDAHASENSLPPASAFDAVIDNRELSIGQTQDRLLGVLRSFGWLKGSA